MSEPNWVPGPVDVVEVDRLRAELARHEAFLADMNAMTAELAVLRRDADDRYRGELDACRAELARVRGERDRLFDSLVVDEQITSVADAIAWVFRRIEASPSLDPEVAAALVEHDKRAEGASS